MISYIAYTKLTKGEKSPDIAGVRIPSPITIQVPIRTRIRRMFFLYACVSSHCLTLKASEFSSNIWRTYVVSFSSVWCWLGIVFTFACLHNSEYRANVPPIKMHMLMVSTQKNLEKKLTGDQ